MLKKSLIILFIIFSIICISNVCAASNTMANDVKNGVSSVTNTVVDGVEDLAKDARNGVGHVENGIEDALTMNNTSKSTSQNVYTATRTAATEATGTNNSAMWVWVVLAIAAIVIIALVWYYGSQNNID